MEKKCEIWFVIEIAKCFHYYLRLVLLCSNISIYNHFLQIHIYTYIYI